MFVKHLKQCPLHNKSYIGACRDHDYLPSQTGSVKCQTNQDVAKEVPHSKEIPYVSTVNRLHCATLLYQSSQTYRSPAQV